MGIKINSTKTEIMTLNVYSTGSVLLDGKTLPHVDTFTYLGLAALSLPMVEQNLFLKDDYQRQGQLLTTCRLYGKLAIRTKR